MMMSDRMMMSDMDWAVNAYVARYCCDRCGGTRLPQPSLASVVCNVCRTQQHADEWMTGFATAAEE